MAKYQGNCIICGSENLGTKIGKLSVPRCCASCSLECEEFILTKLRGLALATLRPCGIRVCKLCKKEFQANHGMQQYCCAQHQRKAQGARMRLANQHSISCSECGKQFTTGSSTKLTCSTLCARKRRHRFNLQWRKRRRKEGKEADYRRR